MKIAFIMVGVSGSGKSTFNKKVRAHFEQQEKDVRVFSLDNCRMNFIDAEKGGQWWSDNDRPVDQYKMAFEFAEANDKKFDTFVNTSWAEALKGDVLIVDNTNLTRKSRARWCTEAKAKGFKVWAVQVMCPLQVVIDRQATRGDKYVPVNVVRDMYMRQQEVLVGSEVEGVLMVDGTSSDMNGVFHHTFE